MKVLHVIPSVGPLRGGPSFAMRAIATGLAAYGVETHVATTDDNGQSRRLEVKLGQPITENGAVYWYFPRQTAFYLCSLPFTVWLWRHAGDYQLIHIHALFSYCSNMAALIARRKRIPYIIRPLGVLNRWGMENRRPVLKRMSFALLERRLMRHAAFIHYTTEQERCEALECGFTGNPVIIPHPVEIPDLSVAATGELRLRYPELQGKRIVLFLSRIDRKKGLDLLIPAFRGVLNDVPNAALVVAGDGDPALIEALRNQCRDMGIDHSVYWPGFLDAAAKLDALRAAEVFVLPSYSENFGIVVVEAMAAGVPVIVTEQVGIFREVAESNAGLVTATAVEPLREAMVRLLSDAICPAHLGQNGATLARSQFAPDVVMNKLIGAYGAALDRVDHAAIPNKTRRAQV